MTDCRAARWTDARELRIDRFTVADPAPDEVQIAVRSVGICGSDLHFFRGDFPARTDIVPGHEFAGIVSAVGGAVTHVRAGDLVGVEPLVRCNACGYCVEGAYHECPTARQIIGEGLDGGMSDFANVPGYTVFPVPAGVDAEVAALAEPLACSVHGYARIGLRAHETALIIGAGSIGLTALLAAKAAGASTLIVARHPHQQAAARRLGADDVLGDDEAGRARLAELRRDESIDVAVETVGGHAETIIEAQRAVRRRGRVLVLGSFAARTVSLSPGILVWREVDLIGAVTYGAPGGRAEYAIALDMLVDHADAARTLVTHRFALDDANIAFATALDKSSRSIKLHLNPTG